MSELLINVFWFWAGVALIVLTFQLFKKSIEIHNTEAAFRHIKGYCEKHHDCEAGCIFCNEDKVCILRKNIAPCAWEEVK